jgi:hypothetical protein
MRHKQEFLIRNDRENFLTFELNKKQILARLRTYKKKCFVCEFESVTVSENY